MPRRRTKQGAGTANKRTARTKFPGSPVVSNVVKNHQMPPLTGRTPDLVPASRRHPKEQRTNSIRNMSRGNELQEGGAKDQMPPGAKDPMPPPAFTCHSSVNERADDKDSFLSSSDEEEDRCEDDRHYESSSNSSISDDTAASRERDRAKQRYLYNNNKGYAVEDEVTYSIKRILKEKIFPKVKILSDTEQEFLCPDFVGKPVDQSRVICETIIREMEHVDTSYENKVRFWITYRSLVKNQLVKFRSNCVEDLKREYFKVKETMSMTDIDDKTKEYLEGSADLIQIISDAGSRQDSPIMSLREDNNKKAFFFFAREFLPCVVKRLFFRQNKFEHLLSEFVTISDEAFTLFLLENNVARWDAMFENGTTKSDDRMPTQKYQSSGVQDDKSGKDGYCAQAALRYNAYYKYISEARGKLDSNALEAELLQQMEYLENYDESKRKKKKNKRKRDGELNYFDESGKRFIIFSDL